MNKNLQEPTTHVSARRRLVRGVFAAPAALSLYSGSALAATSMSCLAKEVAAKNMPELADSGTSDTYIRVQLQKLKKNDNIYTLWIRGADLVPWQKGSNVPFLGSDEWQCFSKRGSSQYSVKQIVSAPPAQQDYQLKLSGKWVALKIDSFGNITGVVGLGTFSPGKEAAVHQSCWTSFRKI